MGYKQITCLVFSLLLLQSVFADEIKEQVNVDLVNIFLSATDSKGNFVSDLKPEELVLKENGKVQPITNFSRVLADDSDVPLTIAFLIDTSGSMEQYFDVASRAATTALEQLRPKDKILLFGFDEKAHQITPTAMSPNDIIQALHSLKPENAGTAIYDSTYEVGEKLNDAPGRRIIVLITDGEDNKSQQDSDALAKQLSAVDISVLTIGLWSWVSHGPGGMPGGFSGMPRRGDLNYLAENTGGYVFFPESAHDVDRLLDKFRSAIANQYYIAYKTPLHTKKEEWRKIEINCTRKGVKLKYRRTYKTEAENS